MSQEIMTSFATVHRLLRAAAAAEAPPAGEGRIPRTGAQWIAEAARHQALARFHAGDTSPVHPAPAAECPC